MVAELLDFFSTIGGKITLFYIGIMFFIAFKFHNNNKIPSILVSMGILGTFFGIFIGLMRFDTDINQIQISIEQLLNGLKTAFLTSIAGVILSLILKMKNTYFEDNSEYSGATIEDIVATIDKSSKNNNKKIDELISVLDKDEENHLEEIKNYLVKEGEGNLSHQLVKMRNKYDEILTNQKKLFRENREVLIEIKKSLTGETNDEGSLNYNLSMLREKNNEIKTNIVEVQNINKESHSKALEKQEELISKFDAFQKEMAKQNTEALVEAIRGAMEDFNSKINEHLGENFKQLNEGVGQMLEWQDKYKEQVAFMVDSFEKIIEKLNKDTEAIEKVSKSIDQIAEKSGSITKAADNLEPILKGIINQKEELEKTMKEFAEISNKAQEAFPKIEQRIDDLTKGFSDSVEKSIERSDNILSKQENAFNRILDNFETLDQKAKNNIESILKNADEMNQKLRREQNEIIKDNVQSLDSALEEELEKSLNSLGKSLASLSNKFVEDYQPLTDRLRDVVRIAEEIEPAGVNYNE